MWYPSGFSVALLVWHDGAWVDGQELGVLSWYAQSKNFIVVQHADGTIQRVRVRISAA